MNTYTVKFLDKSIPDKVVQADDFSFPEQPWEHVLFFTGPERSEVIVYSVVMDQVMSILVQAAA